MNTAIAEFLGRFILTFDYFMLRPFLDAHDELELPVRFGLNYATEKIVPEIVCRAIQIYGAKLDPLVTLILALMSNNHGDLRYAFVLIIAQTLGSLAVLLPVIFWIHPTVGADSMLDTPTKVIFFRESVHMFNLFYKFDQSTAALQDYYCEFILGAYRQQGQLGARLDLTWTLILGVSTGNYKQAMFIVLIQLLGGIFGIIAFKLWKIL